MNEIQKEIIDISTLIVAFYLATAANILKYRRRAGVFSKAIRVFGISLFVFLAVIIILLIYDILVETLLAVGIVIIIALITAWFVLKSYSLNKYIDEKIIPLKPPKK